MINCRCLITVVLFIQIDIEKYLSISVFYLFFMCWYLWFLSVYQIVTRLPIDNENCALEFLHGTPSYWSLKSWTSPFTFPFKWYVVLEKVLCFACELSSRNPLSIKHLFGFFFLAFGYPVQCIVCCLSQTLGNTCSFFTAGRRCGCPGPCFRERRKPRVLPESARVRVWDGMGFWAGLYIPNYF